MININYILNNFLVGTKNYVLVDCPDVQEFLSCSIQDLSSDGKTMSLPILNYRKNMLLCGPFIPSDNPFYVQVKILDSISK